MSLSIPNTAATADYKDWGGGSIYRNGGYLFVGNGAVDVILQKGSSTGLTFEDPARTLAAGYYPLAPITADGISIIGLRIRASAGMVTTPAQQYLGSLDDAGPGIGAGIPFTGSLSGSGGITPVGGIVTGKISSAGAVVAGTGFTAAKTGTGTYVVTFTTPFPATPVVFVTPTSAVAAPVVSPTSASSFQVGWANLSGVASDTAFDFVCYAVQ